MSTKHTKGPWELKHYNDEHGSYACSMIVSSEGRTISKLIPHHGDVPTIPHGEFKYSELDAANAYLISAAPEMLEALYTCLDLVNKETPDEAVPEIKALCERIIKHLYTEGNTK